MLPRFFRNVFCVILSLFFVIGPSDNALAEGITDYLPDDALGFVQVRNAQTANDKISKLMQLMEVPIPPPLTFLKFSTGLGEGIDQQSDLVVALLPGEVGSLAFRPMVLLPMADYAAFAGSVQGDASGEICRATISGEDVLIARHGPYALLMNVEHRATMEHLLSHEPKQGKTVRLLNDWLEKNDVAVVLLSPGLKALFDLGKRGLDSAEQQFAENFEDAEMEEVLEQLQQSFRFYRIFLDLTDAEVDAAALGLAIDEQTNVRLGMRLVLEKDGQLAQIPPVEPSQKSPLAGYREEPFVGVAGGPIPENWADLMGSMYRRMMEQLSGIYGFEDLTEEDWQELQQVMLNSVEGVESVSMILLPGKEEEPLYDNAFGITKVKDAGQYLESYKKAMERWNDLMAKSTGDIQIEYAISSVTIAGKEGLEIVADVMAAVKDPNVPMMEPMFKAMFGEDGKMHIFVLATDETTVVMGISSKEKTARFIEQMGSNTTELYESAEVRATLKLLDPKAPWVALVSPQGTVQWITRWMNLFMGQMGMVPTIPDFPSTPPVGFSLNLVDGRWEADMVLPVKMLQGLARFIKEAKGR